MSFVENKKKAIIIKHLVNPFPNKPWFLHVYLPYKSFETFWKKEELLITRNFSISYSIFFFLR